MDYKKSQLLSDAWKPHKSSEDGGESEPVYISSGKSTPEPSPTPAAQPGVKRKKYHHRARSQGNGGHVKKQKRSSVESRTVSVTRVTLPVYDNSSAEEMDTSRDSSVCESSVSSGLDSIKEEERLVLEKRPKTLPVSLSIPDEVEPGTPFDKVVKAHHQRLNSPRVSSMETKELPSWENFADSNLALRRASSSRQTARSAATAEKSDILFPKDDPVQVVKSAPEASSSVESPPSAFLASPLPISSSPKQFRHPSPTEMSSAPNADLKTATSNGGSSSLYFPTSMDVGVRGPSLQQLGTSPSQLTSVGYSAPVLSPDLAATTRPSSLVVKSVKQAEGNDFSPSEHPPQRSPLLTDQPRPVHLTNSVASTLPSGVTRSSTKSPLSSTTKPLAFPTGAAATDVLSPLGGGVGTPPQQSGPKELPLSHHQPKPQHSHPIPRTSTEIPSNPTGTTALAGGRRQSQSAQHQQVSPSSTSPQETINSPRSVQQVPQSVPVHHKSVAVCTAQTPGSSVEGQQVSVGASRPMQSQAPSSSAAMAPQVSAVTSRPVSQIVSATSAEHKVPIVSSRLPLAQLPVVGVNSTRPASSAPGIQPQQEQQILNRPSSGQPSGVQVLNQQYHHVQQHVQYLASTRPASVSEPQHQVVFTQSARPSSVPLQHQHRPLSVPNQQSQAVAVVAPPRPSSVPTQQVVMSRSTSQLPPASAAPTQHVLVTYSPAGSSASLQQVVVTQPSAASGYVGRVGGQPTTVRTSQVPTSILSHYSPATDSRPALQTQRQVQEQNVAVAAKRATSVQSSSGEADVIITGVESSSRVIQGPSAVGFGERATLTQGGERVVLVNNNGEAIPYQASTVSSTSMGPGAVVKVVGKTVVSYQHSFFILLLTPECAILGNSVVCVCVCTLIAISNPNNVPNGFKVDPILLPLLQCMQVDFSFGFMFVFLSFFTPPPPRTVERCCHLAPV